MPALFLATSKFDALRGVLILIVVFLSLPVLVLVHYGLERCYLMHARRFCRKNGFVLGKWRCGPAFNRQGVKTEFTIVELDCLDAQQQRKLIRLLVWVFGIRKIISNENVPESKDDKPASP
jgi:hypothetical protein